MTRYCFFALKPFLVHCMWPDPGLYPMKRTLWNLEDAEVIRQYKLLCRRVKLVAAQTKGYPSDLLKQASGWCRQTSLVLRPVWSWGPLRSILQVLLQRITTEDFQLMDQWKAFSRFTAVVACSTILEFLGDQKALQGRSPENSKIVACTFSVKPEQLAAVKLNIRRKRRKSADDVSFGPLPVPSRFRIFKRNKLVEIVNQHSEVDLSCVSATIDSHKFFAIGARPSARTSAWHAVRIHHRCRLLRGPEAVWERLGSLALVSHFDWQQVVILKCKS